MEGISDAQLIGERGTRSGLIKMGTCEHDGSISDDTWDEFNNEVERERDEDESTVCFELLAESSKREIVFASSLTINDSVRTSFNGSYEIGGAVRNEEDKKNELER